MSNVLRPARKRKKGRKRSVHSLACGYRTEDACPAPRHWPSRELILLGARSVTRHIIRLASPATNDPTGRHCVCYDQRRGGCHGT